MDARRMKKGEMGTEKAGGRYAACCLAAVLAALALGLLAAAPPASVNYQGVLRDSAGQPVADGSYDMVFTFWDASSGGTMLLGDTHAASGSGAVAVSGGLFSAALGSGTLSAGSETTLAGVFANHTSVYLGVRVGSDTEMTPRIRMVAAPFAQNAHTLDGLGSAAFAASSHPHDASAITSGTLSVARGGTGLTTPGASGNVLTSDGSSWYSSPPPAITGAVVDRYNTTLLRYGSGTAGDPYKLALNLGNTNTWTAQQNFSHNVLFGAGASKIDASGNMCIGSYGGVNTHPLMIYQPQAKVLYQSTLSNDGSLLRLRNSYSTQTALGTIDFEDNSTTIRGEIQCLGDGSLKFSTYYPVVLGERMRIAANGNVGINATPDGAARLYLVSSPYTRTYLGYNEKGIDAQGNTAGGYFKHYGTADEAYLGYSGYGVQANGTLAGGYFTCGSGSNASWAKLATYDYGIDAFGRTIGGHFSNYGSSSWVEVAGSSYKINGTGTMSFVQNHPLRKDRVIVYAAPEGDEVATYTRGTARLISGVAHVKLGETFQWVTNPDVGLTVYLTPRGDCNGLYAESVSTTEMIVRELNGGTSDAVFDYLVYGLRIGFEESSIVQEKRRESFIPAFTEHRERYAKYPELRAYNALERFAGMEASIRGESAVPVDFTRARALRNAIHEYDPAADPPADKLFGYVDRPQAQTDQAGAAFRPSAPAPPPVAAYPPAAAAMPEAQAPSAPSSAGAVALKPALPCFPTAETVELGDVLVMDAAREGFVQLCVSEADALIVGVAAGTAEACDNVQGGGEASTSARTPLAASGVVLCKVDTGYGPIRRGDLLVSSPTPGHAMLAASARPGTILGKALEPMESGIGKIRILVTLK